MLIESLEEEIKLRKEIFWVYANILHKFAEWDEEQIKKRMEEIRVWNGRDIFSWKKINDQGEEK